MKTNGARILESLKIPFELREYEVDPSNSQDLSAITVAKKIAMPPEQVFKTLLTTGGPNSYVFAVIPGDAELDFKKLARVAELRRAEMVPLKDVQPLTGYIRGGVTVFGAKKAYPVFIDEIAILFDRISVSAGARGTQLILAPDDYLRAAATLGAPALTADLTKAAAPPSRCHPERAQRVEGPASCSDKRAQRVEGPASCSDKRAQRVEGPASCSDKRAQRVEGPASCSDKRAQRVEGPASCSDKRAQRVEGPASCSDKRAQRVEGPASCSDKRAQRVEGPASRLSGSPKELDQ